MFGAPLRVQHNGSVDLAQPLHEAHQSGLRGVGRGVEHRLPRHETADADDEQSTDQPAVSAGFHAVRVPALEQLQIRPRQSGIDPTAGTIRIRTCGQDRREVLVEHHIEPSQALAQTAGHTQSVQREHAARIG